MDDAIKRRLADHKLSLPPSQPPRHEYVAIRRVADVVYVSGQTPKVDGEIAYSGRLGEAIDLPTGQEAARIAALHCLSVLEDQFGLERVAQLVKLNGYVASGQAFVEQPQVINGASKLFVDILGEAGRHARTAVGVPWLPGNASVELELIAQVSG